MPPAEQPTSDEGTWKDRYLDSLDELERKEARYQELEGLLRRAVGRLALARMGFDPALDADLETLRNAVRSHADAHRIEALAARIADTADGGGKAATPPAPARVLAELLASLELRGSVAREARRLRQRLSAEPPADEALEQTTALLSKALAPAAGEAAESGPRGLLGRLTGRRPAPAEPAAPPPDTTLPLVTDELARLVSGLALDGPRAEEARTLTRRLARANDSRALRPLLKDLARLVQPPPAAAETPPAAATDHLLPALAALVERFDLPEHLKEHRQAILRDLAGHRQGMSLTPVLTAIADLVAAMRKELLRQSSELEQFLFGVNNRLRQLERHISDTDSVRRASDDNGLTLERRMREGVASMRDSLAGAGNLDDIKAAIVDGLDTVERHLDEHRVREDELSRQAAAHIARLRGQVQDLEAEGSQLRERLQEEHEKTLRDGLTGVYNRLAFDEHLAKAFAHWKRYGTPLALIMIDIDHFKALNDGYGHQAGDKVLKAVAGHIGKQVRESDILARYGGEEFAMVLPETDCPAARGVAEKLRAQVERFGFRHRGEPVRVTVSCGVTVATHGDTPESLIGRADGLLYRAKEEGRNRVVGDC